MNNDGGKAMWNGESTQIFLDECVAQCLANQRNGLSFTRKAWEDIVKGFNEKSGLPYNKKQLKNRLDNLKKEFRIWESLLQETGVGWNRDANTVDATDNWWKKMKEEKKGYDRFRLAGLQFERQLAVIFKGSMASGTNMMSQATALGDDNDVYIPEQPRREGSGDSEEELPPSSPDATTFCQPFNNLRTTSEPTGSGSLGKRKRGEGTSRQVNKGVRHLPQWPMQ